MPKSFPFVLAAAATVVVVTGCSAPEIEPAGPPNILLISLDALRADHLSCAGYDRHTTPFLDRLAAEGTRFSHASVNTHGTPSSHTTMLSSLYQETHRVWADPASGSERAPSIPAEIELLQEILGRHGWTTAAVTGGGWMSASYGFSRGFEHFSDQGRQADQGAALFADVVTEAVGSGRPVFAFFHTYQVHSPYLPPEGYRELFGRFTGAVAPTSAALRPISATASKHLGHADFEYLEAEYDREIRFLDDSLRALFARLDEIGFLESAVVLVTADHGEEFGDHGGVLHRGSLFEELVRVPFILWGRGIEAGVVVPTLVSAVDIAPTLLAAAKVAPPPAMEGRDVLGGNAPDWSDQRIFAQYRDLLFSVRTPRWKLIRHAGGSDLLFDLRNDPKERRNLARSRPELVTSLGTELEAWRASRPRLEGPESGTSGIAPETEERLRALGYLD
jgi:arylsulfatase A-like enzyme